MFLENEQATLNLGQRLANHLPKATAFCIYLHGDIGAGKTTLVRGLLHCLGHTGHVKSPTYTLVEHYNLPAQIIYHFDLYRLADPEELLYLGLDDYFAENALLLVEWPEKGGDWLPVADLDLDLNYDGSHRRATLSANTEAGRKVLATLNL